MDLDGWVVRRVGQFESYDSLSQSTMVNDMIDIDMKHPVKGSLSINVPREKLSSVIKSLIKEVVG